MKKKITKKWRVQKKTIKCSMKFHCMDNVDENQQIAKQSTCGQTSKYIHIWRSYIDPNLALEWCIFLDTKKRRQQQAKSTRRPYVSTSEKNEWTDSCAPVPYVILQKRVCVLSGSVPAEISKPGVDFQECNYD